MNVENIKALAKKMRRLRHEEHYDQGVFVAQTSCGTACCLAGHAALQAGYKPLGKSDEVVWLWDRQEKMKDENGRRKEVFAIGKKWLGLTSRQAEKLFTSSPSYGDWPAEYAERFEEAKRPSRVAADLLDAIADGKVKL